MDTTMDRKNPRLPDSNVATLSPQYRLRIYGPSLSRIVASYRGPDKDHV